VRIASAPAFLLSVLLHGAALGALLFFVHEAKRAGIDGREHAVVAAPGRPDVLEFPLQDDERPIPEVRGEPLVPLLPPLPVPAAVEPLPEPGADDDLEPLEASEVLDEGWRVETLPLAVARQGIRRVGPVEALREKPQLPPPLSAQTPSAPRVPRPAVLEPLHTPIFYPRAADRLGLGGVVIVAFTVHTSGAVIDARVRVSSGHALLDAAALASVRQWRFRPIAHNQRAEKPFRFKARTAR